MLTIAWLSTLEGAPRALADQDVFLLVLGRSRHLGFAAQCSVPKSKPPRKSALRHVVKKAHIRGHIPVCLTGLSARFPLSQQMRSLGSWTWAPSLHFQRIGSSATAQMSHYIGMNRSLSHCGAHWSTIGRSKPSWTALQDQAPWWKRPLRGAFFIMLYARNSVFLLDYYS